MFSERSCGWLAAPAVALAVAIGGCGDDGPTATSPPATSTAPATTAKQPTGTSDRGARRCTKAAFLAALLADVDALPFKVDRVRCEGAFARTRFVLSSCGAGAPEGIACNSAKLAAWRLGARRWRLITYADTLRCGEVRRSAKEFPSALCD